jgi:hypothetical protein
MLRCFQLLEVPCEFQRFLDVMGDGSLGQVNWHPDVGKMGTILKLMWGLSSRFLQPGYRLSASRLKSAMSDTVSNGAFSS